MASLALVVALLALVVAVFAFAVAVFALLVAVLANAAASVAGLLSNEIGADTSSSPRIAGKLVMPSSDSTTGNSSTLWLSDLIASRTSFLISCFSWSVIAITIHFFGYLIAP